MGKFESAAILLLVASACGGTKGPPPAKTDAGPRPDAGPLADAMPQNVCTQIEAMYADLGEITGTATIAPIDDAVPDGPKTITIPMPLGDGATPDVLFLELWGDSAPFEAGFAPVTQTLNGDQADLVLCGACAYIAADFTEGALIDFNMAYAGELIIDTVDPTPATGSITGSLTGLKFHEVTVSEAGQATVPNGCLSELEAVRFNFTIAEAAL